MADTLHGIISYTSRDYQSIMKDFWDIVPTMTELWKPEADSDPHVVLGKFIASAADMLGVNVDWLANEFLGPSVTQRKNAQKLFGLIGYDLGWFTAARTEVTFTNVSTSDIEMKLGFNGATFATLSTNTDITDGNRIITYNILPQSNTMGTTDTRSTRQTTTSAVDVFVSDNVTLQPNESITRVAIEGELRSSSFFVPTVKANGYKIKLPSQHVDTTAIWLKAKSNSSTDLEQDRWVQVSNVAEFAEPEPRFMVTYDSYSNAEIQVSSYIDVLQNYNTAWLVVYWIDCSGAIGCINKDVLQNLMLAEGDTPSANDIMISNLANTSELPHTYVVTGKSPETGKQAYINSRNYINTWDSLVTLPDFTRFLNREPGVSCGIVLDCQKALDINVSIYQNSTLTDIEKSKLYLTYRDFPQGTGDIDINSLLSLHYGFTDAELRNIPFATNFKRYMAMCYAIQNGFDAGSWGSNQIQNYSQYTRYKPSAQFINNVIRDYRPLQAMTTEIDFGYLRIFNFYVSGNIYPKQPVTQDVGNNIIKDVNIALKLYFHPDNRKIGELPTLMEVVEVVRNASNNIAYFDAGSIGNNAISWRNCDPTFFNAISFANYVETDAIGQFGLKIAPEYRIGW